MTKKRKEITMILTVSVPVSMTTAEARREIKTNINHHSSHCDPWELGDVRAVRIGPFREHRPRDNRQENVDRA